MNGFIRLLLLPLLTAVLWTGASAQTDPKPVCVSQETADACFAALDEVAALRLLVEELKKGRETDAKIIQDLKQSLSLETGKVIGLESQIIHQRNIIEFILKQGTVRKKFGLIVF
jgi:hypothetical protein